MTEYPLLAPIAAGPIPVPVEISVASLTLQGRRAVGLQISTPVGVAFYFITSEDAQKVAAALLNIADRIVIAKEIPAPGGTL